MLTGSYGLIGSITGATRRDLRLLSGSGMMMTMVKAVLLKLVVIDRA